MLTTPSTFLMWRMTSPATTTNTAASPIAAAVKTLAGDLFSNRVCGRRCRVGPVVAATIRSTGRLWAGIDTEREVVIWWTIHCLLFCILLCCGCVVLTFGGVKAEKYMFCATDDRGPRAKKQKKIAERSKWSKDISWKDYCRERAKEKG